MLARVFQGLTYALSATKEAAYSTVQDRFHLTQSNIEDYALSAAQVVCDVNIGAMMEMQQDPTNDQTECLIEANIVCVKLKDMATVSAYITGSFDPATFFDKFKSMNIDLMHEFNACEINNLFVVMDQSLSKI